MTSPQQQLNLPPNPQKKISPQQAAATVGSYVKAFIVIALWITAAAVVAACGFVSIRAVIWIAKLAVTALGLGG